MSKFDFLDQFHKEEKLNVDDVSLRGFATEIGGRSVVTESGRYIEIKTEYPLRFLHGVKALETILVDRSVALDCFETTHGNGTVGIEQAVFVDAETTGLSTSPGTVAFLIGVAEVQDDKFTVTQFFLPDYNDEPAMLEAVADLVEGKSLVVSFNGKAFDLPLLEARYIMQRMATPFAGMRHIDLLHVTRRFWRGRFVDNTLQTLEKELLGVYRYDDTPGYLIPQLYFNYLKYGDPNPLSGVMLHNRFDIVTLLYLLRTVQTYLEDAPRFEFYSPLDALVIAKHLCRKGDLENGIAAASKQFDGTITGDADMTLGMFLFRHQKRSGRFDEALATILSLKQSRGETKLLVLEEAAKILEHKRRDFNQAVQLILEAIEYLDSPLAEIPYERVLFWNETLQKRHRRLLAKLK